MLTIGDLILLIDCGTNTETPIEQKRRNPFLIDYLDACGVDHIDYWIVTHWHNDHCYNVSQLLELYGSDDTVVYGVTPKYYSKLAPQPKGTYRQMKDGDRLQAGPLDIRCVGPEYSDSISGLKNRESLNFVVTYGSVRCLFTGDWMDKTVRDRWGDLIKDIDVLKFPHHAVPPYAINRFVYRMMNPRVVLIPSRERGRLRTYTQNEAGLTGDIIMLNVVDGHDIVSTDGINLWTAVGVTAGEYPLGDLVPPRETAE